MSGDGISRVGIVTGERAPELSDDGKKIASALSDRGFRVEPVDWRDRTVDWTAFDAAVVRSCWNYHTEPTRFRDALASMEQANVTVCNPLDVIRWNVHKSYLWDLADAGVRVPETTVVERGENVSLEAILERQGWQEAVVKPAIGTSSTDVWKVSREEARSLQHRFEALVSERDVLVQAFTPEISEGERSIVFFGGEYSHAWNSIKSEDDFSAFDGADPDYEPTRKIIEQAGDVLRTAREVVGIDSALPYARIDYVVRDGDLLLMELELIEPYLGLERGENTVESFCEALAAYFRGNAASTTP